MGGSASEPVGCGAASTGADAGSWAGVGAAGAASAGWGVAVPEMAFLPFAGLPLRGTPAAFAAALAAFFSFLARFLLRMSSGVWRAALAWLEQSAGMSDVAEGTREGRGSYLLPCPDRSEGVKEAHVLEQVRIQPQTGRVREHSNDEQDQPHDCHGEEETNKTQHAHAQVPHAEPELHRPQREQHHREDTHKRTDSVQLLLPLRAFVQPDVVAVVVGLLVLLDADGPQTLDALGLRVVVAFMSVFGVDFGDAEREERQG